MFRTPTFIFFLLMVLQLISCSDTTESKSPTDNESAQKEIITEEYQLYKPGKDILGVLVLFGGYPQLPNHIRVEFPIIELANKSGVAVLLMNFNRRLWLEQSEKETLQKNIHTAVFDNQLPVDNIYIGGFSSGGNVSLLLSNYLIKENSKIQPKGVFIVDSPVDLLALYRCAKRNVDRNFSKVSVKESQGTIHRFDNYFGDPENNIEKYTLQSPYLFETNNVQNLQALNNTKIRLYTEPDTAWWRINRQNEYVDMNAYYIKKLSIELENSFKNSKVELIETQNKGIRANGQRHPHSWSIVDKQGLIEWMLSK